MCGIICSFGSKTSDISLFNNLKHRGPDNQEVYYFGNGFLGHTRLSINDLSTSGNQPFHNEDKSIYLSCNGEIYNSYELRDFLNKKGHTFVSKSDNEVILHGYEEWGYEVLDKLHGMFAFIIWDENEQRIFAARDHCGIKPLYYKADRDHFVAASELSALNRSREIDVLSPLSLGYYFFLGYIPSPYSLLKSYNKLEPGTFLTWQKEGSIKIRRYWTPPDYTDESSKGNNFPEIFHKVIEDHLLSDVPIGSFLSGGIDSTSIVTALKSMGYNTKTISIGFPNSIQNEAPLAEKTAEYLGLDHRTVELDSEDTLELVERVGRIYDEPQGYSALLTMTKVCEAVNKKYKVFFSGDGGDEVFGGYNWYRNLGLNYSSFKRRKINELLYKLTGRERFLNTSYFKTTSDLHRHARRLYPRFLPEEIESIMKPFGLKFNDEIALYPFKKWFSNRLPLKRALQRMDLMTFCADSINPKIDRASMAQSMEIRVPFLDKRLIEYGLTLPISSVTELNSKQILRSYLNGKVPEEVLHQPKRGFSAKMFTDINFLQMKKYNRKNTRYFRFNTDTEAADKHWVMYCLNRFLS